MKVPSFADLWNRANLQKKKTARNIGGNGYRLLETDPAQSKSVLNCTSSSESTPQWINGAWVPTIPKEVKTCLILTTYLLRTVTRGSDLSTDCCSVFFCFVWVTYQPQRTQKSQAKKLLKTYIWSFKPWLQHRGQPWEWLLFLSVALALIIGEKQYSTAAWTKWCNLYLYFADFIICSCSAEECHKNNLCDAGNFTSAENRCVKASNKNWQNL